MTDLDLRVQAAHGDAWLVERGFADGATLAHLNPDSDRVAALYRRLGFVDTAGFDVYVDL